jgi:hypothetical protein
MLRRILKDGEAIFYEGSRAENKEKALKLLEELKKAGYNDFEIYSNSFGYIVK